LLTLVSPPPTHQPSGSGKTSLITHIIATALSTPTPSSAIILIDPLQHFSIPLLTATLLRLFTSTSSPPPPPSTLKTLVKNALHHLHILHPPTFPSLISTLRSLPTYLFSPSLHHSTHRRIHSLILDDTDAFLPSIPPSTTSASASATLCFHLTNLAKSLDCALITSTRSTSPKYFRPALPTSWPREGCEVRIALRKVEAKKVGAGMSVEEAEAERDKEERGNGWCEGWRVGGRDHEGGGGGGGGGGRGKGLVIKIDKQKGVEIGEKK
ncbi:hypothetical protein COCMIDRAFT_106453, partial [Bipolaris oryzae ATCC 44560]